MGPDLAGLTEGQPPQHRQMTIGEVALDLLDGAGAPRLNALSMASSGVHAHSNIHMYASDGTLAFADYLM